MHTPRIKNTARNIYTSLIYRIITLLFPFVVNTIIIKSLGVEYLGLGAIFASILQVLSLAEMGIGSALIFSMYEPVEKDDTPKICALLRLYRRVYLLIGGAILAFGLICMPFLPIIIKKDVPEALNIYILFLISLVNTTIGYFLFAYKSALFQANQRQDIIDKIKAATTTALYISEIVILLITKNYYLFCILQPIFTIINSLILESLSKKFYPDLKCEGKIDKAEKNEIFERVKGLFINKLCTVASNSFDSIIISAFLGLSILGQYQNYYVITNAVLMLLGIIPYSATASVGNSIVSETEEKNYNDFSLMQFGYSLLTGWAGIFLLCLIQPFVKIWVGENLMFGFSVAIVFTIYMYAISSTNVFMCYREATGTWANDKIRPIVEALLNLTLNIILVRYIGITGVLLSTIFTMGIIRTVWGSYYLFNEYFIHHSHKKYLWRLLYFAVTIGITALLTYLVVGLIPTDGIPGLLLKFLVCVVMPIPFFTLFYFKFTEFKQCIDLVKGFIKKNE